jgi:hypothetical protein
MINIWMEVKELMVQEWRNGYYECINSALILERYHNEKG